MRPHLDTERQRPLGDEARDDAEGEQAQHLPPDLQACGRLLLDVFRGDPALSIRGEEAEEAWRVVEPVLSAWERGLVPLEEYPAGSDGPPERHAMPERRDDLLHEESVMPAE
ncbi:hypothetical protein ACFWGR_19700 [Streptomyces sp. NPDC060311]|uniref:hypothetical protein n=1 Tax=Streptomyces TaxID=1883 RepID=UPI00210AE5A9|nr:hypothetical protein [Streptomyces coelicoflavus]MCQ4198963.1 hypothetical protein [Streptomyces coelicoflavus]